MEEIKYNVCLNIYTQPLPVGYYFHCFGDILIILLVAEQYLFLIIWFVLGDY